MSTTKPDTCCPSLDCTNDELIAYIRSMKGGERVMEMGGSGMVGMRGTVEVRDDGSVCIRWDHAEYADCAGVMVTSFTGGARIIEDSIPDTLMSEKAPKPGVSLETTPFCDKQRLVRLMWAVRGRYCQFETGDVVKLSKHGDHARLERVEWRNSLTISNVLSIEDYLIAYEDARQKETDEVLELLRRRT